MPRGVLTRRAFVAAAFAAPTVAGLMLATGCSRREESPSGDNARMSGGLISDTVFVFDTVVTISALCDSATLSQAVDLCYRFDSLFSRTVAGSDVSRINAACGQPVEVAAETARLISLSLAYGQITGGVFDITIGAASELWDFKEGIVPDRIKLDEAVSHIDYRMVSVDGTTVVLADPLAKIDLGGVAKGFVADELRAFLRERGCRCACIDVGGTVVTLGERPEGGFWRVGIADPHDLEGSPECVIELAGDSVVTSGITQRCFEKDGVTYWHILDPRTGWPIQTDVASASWVSSSAVDGEGCVKALFCMSEEECLEFARAQGAIDCIIVNRRGGMRRLLDAS